MPIRLPDNLTGENYEDFVTAVLSTVGYFVETNLTLREASHDLLECDIIATPIRQPDDGMMLIEAKSGDRDRGSLFELYGKMQFLNIPRGCIVRPKSDRPERREALQTIQKHVDVHYATLDLAAENLDFGCIELDLLTADGELLGPIYSAVRYGRAAQRRCLRDFIKQSRNRRDETTVAKARQYARAIENAFLARSAKERARLLYEAWSDAPKVSGELVQLMVKDGISDRNAIWRKVRNSSELLWIQHAMIMEHTARLGIVKNGMLCAKEPTVKHDGLIVSSLPSTFDSAWRALQEHPHGDKIARLLQVFIFSFGGFYSTKDHGDLELIASVAGMPVDQVVPGLEFMDRFFPYSEGWFTTFSNELKVLKMVPAVLRGVGVFSRTLGGSDEFYENHPQTDYVLRSWQKALYATVEPDCTVD